MEEEVERLKKKVRNLEDRLINTEEKFNRAILQLQNKFDDLNERMTYQEGIQ